MTEFEKFQAKALESDMAACEAVLFSTEKSQKRTIEDFDRIDAAIRTNIVMMEKFFPLAHKYLDDIVNTPNTDADQKTLAYKFADDCTSIADERGNSRQYKERIRAFNRYMSRFRTRADVKKENVQAAQATFMEKMLPNGEYADRLLAIRAEFEKLYKRLTTMQADYKGEKYRYMAVNTCGAFHNAVLTVYNDTFGGVANMYAVGKRNGYVEPKKEVGDE